MVKSRGNCEFVNLPAKVQPLKERKLVVGMRWQGLTAGHHMGFVANLFGNVQFLKEIKLVVLSGQVERLLGISLPFGKESGCCGHVTWLTTSRQTRSTCGFQVD